MTNVSVNGCMSEVPAMLNQDLARCLCLGAHQALREGQGILVEQRGIQLEALLLAEYSQDVAGGATAAAALQLECASLLSRAAGSADSTQDR